MDTNTSQNLIKFSYFDPFDVFETVRKELEDRLPFSNLHWKPLNDSLRTISSLPVKIVAETDDQTAPDSSNKPLVLFLVISCTSIDEYRTKVRPLVRQWLPSFAGSSEQDDPNEMPVKRIALLYTNSGVSESNRFKTVSFSEKFSKDFPLLTTIEIKSIYRSERQKSDFWNGTMTRLRRYTMETFEQRLDFMEKQRHGSSGSDTIKLASLQENILNLFLSFHLNDEASRELENLKHTLFQNLDPASPAGELEIPFQITQNDGNKSTWSFAPHLANHKLTVFELNKFFFSKQCELIQNTHAHAARNARLYQLTKSFLKTINKAFKDSPLLAEFKWSFIDSLLPVFDHDESNIYREIVADLNIVQRDCWLDLAYASKGFKLLHRAYPTTGRKAQLEQLNATFSDEELFHKTYLITTKEIISLLNNDDSKKYRTVDILSIEIGLLHYQRKEYESAITILHSCYEYYKESSWNSLAFRLLEYFIDCLLNCSGLGTIAIGHEAVPTSTVLSNSILDLLTSVNSDESKAYWWDRFLKINEKCNGSLIYPLTNLFDFHLERKLVVTKPNIFGLIVKITNERIPKPIMVKDLQLILKNDKNEFLNFQLRDFTITPGDNTVSLECARILFGSFTIVRATCTVGKTILCKEFHSGDDSVIVLERPIDARNFDIIVSASKQFELAKNTIALGYFNKEQVTAFKLVLTALPTEGTSKIPLSFSKKGNEYSFTVDEFDMSSIDYFGLFPCEDFKLQQELIFRTSDCPDKEFYQRDNKTFKSTLPVSVSVEDIVRNGSFFFKFLINSSSQTEPILLHKSDLLPSKPEKFVVDGGFSPDTPLMIKHGDDNTCYSFFQVTTRLSALYASEDFFHLRVVFNELKDQLDHLVTNAILIQGNPEIAAKMESHHDTWNSMVLTRLVYDYEAFESSFLVRLVPAKVSVSELKEFLASKIQDKQFLEASVSCLLVIQKGYQFSRLEAVEYTRDLTPSTLLVPVSLPSLKHHFSVNINRLTDPALELELGQLTPFSISVTDAMVDWQKQNSGDEDYVLELFNTNEWLIDGKRRYRINGGRNDHTIRMIPLRRGYLKYPKIEVTENGRKVSEVHYLNMNEVTLVI
ncbi:LAME_0C04654g1_1 [Lachancea meyersii CBS 8951]|uniref:LAME_0C04654g1_1 n=1 Tax=Lachancea meyersii CBS 8951 TaxID=1266667 RepID=A0A1G4J192_9SACH|nr:LAME_0C04654g1_1 [Lachancea meyersii CBS 8951]